MFCSMSECVWEGINCIPFYLEVYWWGHPLVKLGILSWDLKQSIKTGLIVCLIQCLSPSQPILDDLQNFCCHIKVRLLRVFSLCDTSFTSKKGIC